MKTIFNIGSQGLVSQLSSIYYVLSFLSMVFHERNLALLIMWILSDKSVAEYIECKLLGASWYVYCLLPAVKHIDEDQ